MKLPLYLQRSPKTGVFSFRIAVPPKLRDSIGKREIKRSLKTKDERKALVEAAALYDEARRRFETVRIGDGPMSPRQAYEATVQWARDEGFNPTVKPNPYLNEDDYLGREAAAEQYVTKMRMGLASALDEGRHAALAGTLAKPEYTITDLVRLYLEDKNGTTQRVEAKRKPFEQMVRRYETYLLKAIGLDKPVTQINRQDARAFREFLSSGRQGDKPLKPGSINKALRIVSAMFAHGIREWELDVTQPFSALGVEEPEASREKRRSFTAHEMRAYLEAATHMNPEAQACTVLMIYTGARTSEIVGLERQDVSLDGLPFVYIRPNATRPRLKTPASARRIPLLEPAIIAIRELIQARDDHHNNGPLFPRYTQGRGSDRLSAIQNKAIRTRMKIADPKLVGYSTRHTMKDRLRDALVLPDLQDAVLGHNRGQISDGYGSGYWLPRLHEALLSADPCIDIRSREAPASGQGTPPTTLLAQPSPTGVSESP